MAAKIYDSIELTRWGSYGAVSRSEAEFIHSFLKEKKPKATLEVGLAFGVSAVHILSATRGTHYAMDPYQQVNYKGAGLKNVKRLNLGKRLVFYQDFSHNVLPKLLSAGVKVDFAFIDGGHKFDEIFLDFFYVDLLLSKGGYVLFDDLWMRSTQLVISWIKTNRKDYFIVPAPSKKMVMFQKKGQDCREWYHFKEFYTFKSFFSHANFRRRQKDDSTRMR